MPISFDEKALRYRAESGRFVRRDAVTSALERARSEGRKRVARLTEDLRAGRINLPAWQIAVRDEIKAQHVLAAGIARGGKANLSPAELGRVGSLTRVQYERLNAYARQIASGQRRPSVGRSEMYVNASRLTFSETERRMYRNAGYEVEYNVLGASESCEGCRAESRRGEVPVGTLRPVGLRTCLTNCGCEIRFKRAA